MNRQQQGLPVVLDAELPPAEASGEAEAVALEEVPPLAEQGRFATILDKADALRAKRRAALAKLDALLQAYLDSGDAAGYGLRVG